MLKTALVLISQILISSPILLSILRTIILLRAGNTFLFAQLFAGLIVNLFFLGIILISLILIIYKNNSLSKKAIIIHLLVGLISLGLSYFIGNILVSLYKVDYLPEFLE